MGVMSSFYFLFFPSEISEGKKGEFLILIKQGLKLAKEFTLCCLKLIEKCEKSQLVPHI
jgi:hypothetical protein